MKVFVCRTCGKPGSTPAFENAHGCLECWATWETNVENFRAGVPSQADADIGLQHCARPDLNLPVHPALGLLAPAIAAVSDMDVRRRPSVASVAEHGAVFCPGCEAIIEPTGSDCGQPDACPICGNCYLERTPPVPGYHANACPVAFAEGAA